MTDAVWYADMAAAMKERDRALTGVARWQEALAAAEERIQALRESDTSDDGTKVEAASTPSSHYDQIVE